MPVYHSQFQITTADDLLLQKISKIFSEAILKGNSIYQKKRHEFVHPFLNVPEAFRVSGRTTTSVIYDFFHILEKINLESIQLGVPQRLYRSLCNGLDQWNSWKTKIATKSHIVSAILIAGGRSVLLTFDTKLNTVRTITKPYCTLREKMHFL